ncbi:hypothetical protein IFM89_029289 [Coptis chinensis]|uniref:ABC transporter domain-containing protein n=1 Tax=Coptis chinensis TaxID=261450 RepID=A0A835LVS3_9MAGN|nr:hypothetical protein IFM89_029289 [Coptis chinensis]
MGYCCSTLLSLAPPLNSLTTSLSIFPRIKRFNFANPRPLNITSDYSCFEVKGVSYRPPGTQLNLLSDVHFSLHEKSLGLIFGRSGSGKTTLLQLLAGLSKPTSGTINIQRYGEDGKPNQAPIQLPPERVGIVFQFPERYFLADTVLEEVTFGWPRQRENIHLKEQLASGLQRAINSVGLNGISLDEDPHALSGGYKRRLALAIQLVKFPDLLILDEPLAGLGWDIEQGYYGDYEEFLGYVDFVKLFEKVLFKADFGHEQGAFIDVCQIVNGLLIASKSGKERSITFGFMSDRISFSRDYMPMPVCGNNHICDFMTIYNGNLCPGLKRDTVSLDTLMPLRGDWKARADVVKLLNYLKKELTLLVVSHDLKHATVNLLKGGEQGG